MFFGKIIFIPQLSRFIYARETKGASSIPYGPVSKDRFRPWRPKNCFFFHAGGKDWSF
jgi:hypothetical protein